VTDAADAAFMRRAIAVARASRGLTAPNPSVGCVLVGHGAVLAEAATAPGGRPHAEEQALAAAGERARGATAYVTLEPCGERSSGVASCAERLVGAGIARVVIACEDPSPYASGRGTERLRAAGLEVESGVLAEEAAPLYADWLDAHAAGLDKGETARPAD
jgi:diaminohydroxyphosphoribosylaminopyrimidine deaminase/5-amino-6-(5-phosphoribosylamino)uracil reductase